MCPLAAFQSSSWHFGGIDADGDAGNTMAHPVKMIRKRSLTEERVGSAWHQSALW